ncbi:AraC family transcriptional regulator [Spirosoma sp. BT702]|uniref:AraC family transcriptional regulator n=1 Tax=Spirosoma profusum TaxID=2771354 RepID=A0A927ASG2_9BACT|nr:helix-turn-helix domain-containing protein [Spirosoma profusum]MBD2703813.1 AraC family transcriptional regulator [Spirosoma profusum]
MNYLDFIPNAQLRPYIERYAVVEASVPIGEQILFFVPPSSTGQLAINCGLANHKPNPVSGRLDQHFVTCLIGPFTRRHQYIIHGHVHTVVAYFTPTGMHTLLGVDLTSLADQTIDFQTILPADAHTLAGSVRSAEGDKAKVNQLELYLMSKLIGVKPLKRGLDTAVLLLQTKPDTVSISEVAAATGLPQRTLERRFREATGLRMKQFSRINRFLVIRSAIVSGQIRSWEDLLNQGGYYDQSHYIKEFKQFTGQPPSAYFAHNIGFDNFLLKSP